MKSVISIKNPQQFAAYDIVCLAYAIYIIHIRKVSS